MAFEQTIKLRDGVNRLEFLSASEGLVKLIIDQKERNRFIASSGDFSMNGNLSELRIYSNTFEPDDYQNTHWITNSSDSSLIAISTKAFSWLNNHELTKEFCSHNHTVEPE